MLRTNIKHAVASIALVAVVATTVAPTMAFAATVKLAGSTSLQPLAQLWATAYHKAHPTVSVTVAGGGSGVGFSAAKSGSVDIGMSSKTAADSDSAATLTKVARDAVAVVVNPKNPTKFLTVAQVQSMYRNGVKTWAGTGAKKSAKFNANHAIVLTGRTGASGTYDYFKTAILGASQSSKTKQYASNGMVRAAVARDPYAVGYLSIAYINSSVRGVGIKANTTAAAKYPTKSNAIKGVYPYVRYLYFVSYSAHPWSSDAQAFVNYCKSSAGQKIAAAENLPL
jgi:phosphate transport system substrate-binding protein